jgi:hypothetical protein
MNKNEKRNADLGAETVRAFLDQFGSPSDPTVGVFLEVLLEELFNAKIVSLFGGSQQTRDQADSSPPGGIDGIVSGDRPEATEPPIRLGETGSGYNRRKQDVL